MRKLILIASLIATPCFADEVSDLTKCIAERNEVIGDRAVLVYQFEQLAKAYQKRVKTIKRLHKACGPRCKKIK